MIIMLGLFLCSFLYSSDSQILLGVTVKPDQYVDCTKWMPYVDQNPADFLEQKLSFDESVASLGLIISLGVFKKETWPTSQTPTYVEYLKDYFIWNQAAVDQIKVTGLDKLMYPYTQFFCFIVSIQLKKSINRMHIDYATQIANGQGVLVDEIFIQIKNADFERLSSMQAYSQIERDAKEIFRNKRVASLIVGHIKHCDKLLAKEVENSIEQDNSVNPRLKVFGQFFSDLNKILGKKDSNYKSRL